jgi:putative SOS response-associated peptidase YedK
LASEHRNLGARHRSVYQKAKMPFYVTRKDRVPFTFAGFWERWGLDTLLICTLHTTDATDGIRGLHTRMPVILPKDGFEPWLSGSDPVVDPGFGDAMEVASAVATTARYARLPKPRR